MQETARRGELDLAPPASAPPCAFCTYHDDGDGRAAYHDGDEQEERDGPVSAEEGVGEEGGDERRDGAGAEPVGDAVGGGLAAHVQPVLEVVHQVRRHREVGGAQEAVVRW